MKRPERYYQQLNMADDGENADLPLEEEEEDVELIDLRDVVGESSSGKLGF